MRFSDICVESDSAENGNECCGAGGELAFTGASDVLGIGSNLKSISPVNGIGYVYVHKRNPLP